jgi:hypothetical protein
MSHGVGARRQDLPEEWSIGDLPFRAPSARLSARADGIVIYTAVDGHAVFEADLIR